MNAYPLKTELDNCWKDSNVAVVTAFRGTYEQTRFHLCLCHNFVVFHASGSGICSGNRRHN